MYATTRKIAGRLVHNDLPLGGLRLALMLLTLVFSIVAGALCVKLWTQHNTVQKHLNANLPSGVSAVLEYQDVKITSILVFITNNLLTFAVSHIFLAMLQDIYNIVPPSMLRRFGLTLPEQPLSNITLPHQVIGMLVTTALFVAASALHTAFVFSRSSTVTVHQGSAELPGSAVQSVLDRLGIALPYRDTQYIRVSAELPWPAVLFAVLANVATLVAWYQYRHTPVPSPVDSITSDSVAVEKLSEDGKRTVGLRETV
ncbi:hypothetical protein DFH07DRAFT_808309 [Mycena maculata]|uniref:Uncharacterized protein n=1 Tax=Mycena maculata TaxID=230809 RepID=A0AAD7NN23_9AGAR|nr:hypothetical protein DFH07DRAFT_808309 [Mycena maculata]